MVARAVLPRCPGVASACVALRPQGRHTVVVAPVSAIGRPLIVLGLGGTTPFGFADGTPVSSHGLGYPTPFDRASDASSCAHV